MELIHYSQEILTTWRPVSYLQKVDFKPAGLWLSVESQNEKYFHWKDWCESEEFNLKRLKYKHKITLSPQSNLLILNTETKMWDFTNKYAKSLRLPGLTWDYKEYVNWQDVAKLYQGILIYPYFYQFRLKYADFCWYYPWDCASGCIWDMNILESITYLNTD